MFHASLDAIVCEHDYHDASAELDKAKVNWDKPFRMACSKAWEEQLCTAKFTALLANFRAFYEQFSEAQRFGRPRGP